MQGWHSAKERWVLTPGCVLWCRMKSQDRGTANKCCRPHDQKKYIKLNVDFINEEPDAFLTLVACCPPDSSEQLLHRIEQLLDWERIP